MELPKEKRARMLWFCRDLAYYYALKGFAVSREVGLPLYHGDERVPGFTKQRADFIAVQSRTHQVVIVETKSCLQDFTSDEKWRGYLKHCNKFYFCADEDTAAKIVKILEADPDAKGVGVISFPWKPGPHGDRKSFIRSAKTHERQTPLEPLLWQMAARNSGYSMAGLCRKNGVFWEDREEDK